MLTKPRGSQVNRRFLYLTKLLVVWIFASRRGEHILPVGLNMTSARELEGAIVSAVQLDLRLSSDTIVSHASWTLPWVFHKHAPGMLVGKYLIFINDQRPNEEDVEGIVCINVQTAEIWRIYTSFDVDIRWDKMKIDATREVMINGEVGIVLTLSNAKCVLLRN